MKNIHDKISAVGKVAGIVVLIPAILLVLPLATPEARAQGYIAFVIGIDYPEGCLRIRAAPSTSADIIGCADMGSKLRLTGAWSGKWAEISRPIYGWVYGPQIDPGIAPRTVVVTTPWVEYHSYPYRYSRYWRYGRWWSRPWYYAGRHKKYKYWRKGYGHGHRHGRGHHRWRRPVAVPHSGSVVRASRGGGGRSSFRVYRGGGGGHVAGFRGGGGSRGGRSGFRGRGGGGRRRR